MSKGLKIAEPPARRVVEPPAPEAAPAGGKFRQVRETEMVQFNKRVPRSVADGYELLAIRTRRKVPELLAEGLALLQERHGKV
jgi:hypothetical protein